MDGRRPLSHDPPDCTTPAYGRVTSRRLRAVARDGPGVRASWASQVLHPAAPLPLTAVPRRDPGTVRQVVVVEHHGVTSTTTKLEETLLGGLQQRRGDTLPAVFRRDGESVEVTAPTVEAGYTVPTNSPSRSASSRACGSREMSRTTPSSSSLILTPSADRRQNSNTKRASFTSAVRINGVLMNAAQHRTRRSVDRVPRSPPVTSAARPSSMACRTASRRRRVNSRH